MNFLKIEIISYNIFQMDGLKYIIPLSDQVKSFNQLKMTLLMMSSTCKQKLKQRD